MKNLRVSIGLISILLVPIILLGNSSRANACIPGINCPKQRGIIISPSPAQIEAEAAKELAADEAVKKDKAEKRQVQDQAEADRVAKELADRVEKEEQAVVEKAQEDERAAQAEAAKIAKAEAEAEKNANIQKGVGTLLEVLFPSKK